MGSCCSASKTDLSHAGNNIANETTGSNSGYSSPTKQSHSQLKSFQFTILQAATKNFHPNNKLGQGEFGEVYKGWIDEHSLKAANSKAGTAVAVKKLKSTPGSQGRQELLTEIKHLGELRHPNIVKLFGYCSEDGQQLLVYEFVPNGSLEKCLFEESRKHPLAWNQRIKIALSAAKGLEFLHHEKVIYRDFKTSNILLDSDYNAKLGDFGFARDAPTDGRTHATTRYVGTSEYWAPEYQSSGHLSVESDVYSFGVVLLEMMSGKKAKDPGRASAERNLVSWARPYFSSTNHGNYFKLLDNSLRSKVDSSQLKTVTDLVSRCLSEDPHSRPKMAEVVKDLKSLLGT